MRRAARFDKERELRLSSSSIIRGGRLLPSPGGLSLLEKGSDPFSEILGLADLSALLDGQLQLAVELGFRELAEQSLRVEQAHGAHGRECRGKLARAHEQICRRHDLVDQTQGLRLSSVE